jgi:hypothetical protein
MSRGGYRPGTGRPKGAKDKKPRKGSNKEKKAPAKTERDQIKQILALGHKAKARMYQEFLLRISKNENLSITEKKLMDKIGADLESEIKESEKPDMDKVDSDASDFLRSVWNDPEIEIALRIRAAEIIFRNDGEKKGKKNEKSDKAKQAGAGKFAAGRPPITLVK